MSEGWSDGRLPGEESAREADHRVESVAGEEGRRVEEETPQVEDVEPVIDEDSVDTDAFVLNDSPQVPAPARLAAVAHVMELADRLTELTADGAQEIEGTRTSTHDLEGDLAGWTVHTTVTMSLRNRRHPVPRV